ncbi:MAG TPA: ornithine cyclodeaminase family protein [Bryobacteraceae bacterium]|nr:ornithine cyclodeaminase family protein [Bryobacteraceae bacterium]
MRYFTEDDVLRFLPMPAAIEALRRAFIAYGEGKAQNQPRRRLILPGGSVLHSLAASYDAWFGTKVYSTHVKHGAHFTFLLYDAATAKPLAQFEANHLGQIRTGAATGLAVDLLAPRRPLTVAIIGAGFQARTQLEALRSVRDIKEARVWSRKPESRESFAAAMQANVASSAEAATEGADVIVTATFSKEPVIPPTGPGEGTLIVAMGGNMASRSEVPAELVRRARIVVDDIEQCKIEAGELLLAGIDFSSVETLGAIAASTNTKAGDDRRLTLFKSVGIALEDVAAAAHVYQAATATPVP